MQLIVHTFGIKNIFKTHMRSEGASSVGKETEASGEAAKIFSIAPAVESKITDARISRRKLKEWVQIARSESTTEKAKEKAQNAEQTASRTTPAAADLNALAQLLLAQTLARPGVANDAAKSAPIRPVMGWNLF